MQYPLNKKDNMSKTQTIAASDARNNFSDLVSQVQYKGETFLIERYGEVVAKIVPVEAKVDLDNLVKKSGVEETQQASDQGAKDVHQPAAQDRQNGQESQRQESQQSSASRTANELAELRARYQRMTAARRTGSPTSFTQRASVVRAQASQDSRQNTQTPSTSDQAEADQKDAGWSALKKLEELIAVQKAKTVQGEGAGTSGVSNQVEQNDAEQPEIIRKKIEL